MKAALLLLATTDLAGCATTAASDRVAWDQGWRQVTVASISDELRWYQRARCGRSVGLADKVLALRYRSSGQTRWALVPLAAANTPPLGALLRFNVNTCELAPAAVSSEEPSTSASLRGP